VATAARLVVPPEAAGERVDRFLAARLEVPRNQVQQWIAAGRVRLGVPRGAAHGGPGRPATAGHRLAAGERLEWDPPEAPVEDRVAPEPGELSVLWRDEQVLVVDKPAGLTVHPGAGRASGTLAHRLIAAFPELAGVGGRGRPGIVHRLDHDTSGALVVARTPEAYQKLSAAFAGRRVEKRYLAICHGVVAAPREVDAPLGRHPSRRQEMAVRPGGRPARTLLRPLASVPVATLLEVRIETGRTHQIRVHLKSVGHPLVGDPLYGEARWKGARGGAQALLRDFPRPALHAWRVAFPHPRDDRRVEVEAPVPRDFRDLWQGLAGRGIDELLGGAAAAPG
jgi:23S rRNA pseudouridine1911/1915/1917 synthase